MSIHKRKRSPIKSIMDIVVIGLSLFKVIPNLIHVVGDEAKEIKSNIAALICLYLIAIVVTLSVWSLINVIAIVYMLSLHLTLLQALIIALIMNLVLLSITFILILKAKSNLTFKKTRVLVTSLFQ